MKKQTNKKWLMGLAIMLTMVLAACGRDVSTVENALAGTWKMSEAYVNGESLVDLLVENAFWFDVDESEIPRDEAGNVEYDIEFYYDEGLLTTVDSEGEVRETPYEILTSDEENNSLQIEYAVEEEGMVLVLQEDMKFTGDERESKTSTVKIVDVQTGETSPSGTELEQQLEQFGQEIVRELMQSIELTLEFDYVAEEAPTAIQE